MERHEFRTRVLFDHGASLNVAGELLAYTSPVATRSEVDASLRFPLDDELHVAAWEQYAAETRQTSAYAVLRQRLVQLAFPIREGISESEPYRAATRRGASVALMPEASGLILEAPEALRLCLHRSLAGAIPTIVTATRNDFIALVQAFTARNEPVPTPDSMGACIVAGYNNWNRVRALRSRWELEHPGQGQEGWIEEFRSQVAPYKPLYQDRFLLLSDGPYSGVTAAALGMPEPEWTRLSQAIRLEHEATHYLMLRLLGTMRNNMLDEIIADYRGIVAAVGRFRADWFLRFLGLEDFPHLRPDGRLNNYRGEPPLSDAALALLAALLRDAAANLERLGAACGGDFASPETQGQLVLTLASLTLEELASPHAPQQTLELLRSRMRGERGKAHFAEVTP